MKKLLFTLAFCREGYCLPLLHRQHREPFQMKPEMLRMILCLSGNFWKSRGIFRNGKCLLKEVFNKFVP